MKLLGFPHFIGPFSGVALYFLRARQYPLLGLGPTVKLAKAIEQVPEPPTRRMGASDIVDVVG